MVEPNVSGESGACHWGGGNDIIWCSTCGAEYAYAKGERKPPCPRAPAMSPREGEDAGAASGRSPASAIGSAEAPSSSDLSRLTEENAALRAERDRLREVLKPFASFGERWTAGGQLVDWYGSAPRDRVYNQFTPVQFRAARQALTPSEEPPRGR